MLDLALIALFIVWIVHVTKTHANLVRAQSRGAAVAPPETKLQLNLEGVARLTQVPSFVGRFGVKPQWVSECGFLAGPLALESLLPAVRRCLEHVYEEGGTRGSDVPGLLFRNEPVPLGKALYFAACSGRGPDFVLAFVYDAPPPAAG